MNALGKVRAVIGMVLLGPGLVVASGTEAIVPSAPVASAVGQAGMQQPMMWMQMMPAAGMQMPYWTPPPGMVWPYPAPMTMPAAPYPAWRPVMMLWVPVTVPATPASGVDYGPVADTPVVYLSQPDEATGPASTSAVPEAEAAAPADSTSDKTEAPEPKSSLPALPLAEATQPAAVVDYGPIAPTPVVDIEVLQQPSVADQPAQTTTAKPKSTRKKATSATKKLRSGATAKPVKKRMCWSGGVVAPCR